MIFTVEDGTGLAASNSYASVEFADDYFTNRGVLTWIGTLAEKQAWLIQATDYINLRFGRRLAGERLLDTQALLFPLDIYEGMPANLLKATCEYALRAKAGPLAPDLVYNSSGMAVIEVEKNIGPLKTRTKFASSGVGSIPSKFRAYPSVDGLMSDFLVSNSQVVRN